jgi:hypothetical protein
MGHFLYELNTPTRGKFLKGRYGPTFGALRALLLPLPLLGKGEGEGAPHLPAVMPWRPLHCHETGKR